MPESWSPDGRYLSFSVRKSGSRDARICPVDAHAGGQERRPPFGGVVSVEPIGSVFSPDGKWLAYAKGTAAPLSDANRGVFVQPFPATGAVYQAPRQLVDFHPVWAASGAGNSCYTAAAAAGRMVAVPRHHRGGVTFGTPVLFPASVTGNRVASEPRAWDILPDGRFIGIGPDDGRRGAEFLVRDAPGPELVRGIEAAGSGAVADGDGNRHAPRPLRRSSPRSAPAGWARSIGRATRRWAAMWR